MSNKETNRDDVALNAPEFAGEENHLDFGNENTASFGAANALEAGEDALDKLNTLSTEEFIEHYSEIRLKRSGSVVLYNHYPPMVEIREEGDGVFIHVYADDTTYDTRVHDADRFYDVRDALAKRA